MKTNFLITLSIITMLFASCKDNLGDENSPKPENENNNQGNGNDVEIVEGFNFSPQTPNADDSLKITFKAATSSALYSYSGDVYLHTGVVVEGEWQGVPADWNENIAKCKFTLVSPNVWSISMKPTIREWFDLGETPVEKLGVIARSADGTKKGIDADIFVDITDDTYTGFAPAAIIEMAMPADYKYGVNIVSDTKAAFVLYDKDTNGNHKDYAHIVGDFNNWILSNTEASQMYRDNAAGTWWIEVENLDPTKEYAFQYYVGTEEGSMRLGDAYSEKILDPSNDKYIPASTYGDNLTYPEGGIGIVSVFQTRPTEYAWTSNNVSFEDKGDIVIYELLIRDFTETGDLNGVMSKLDYIEDLGVNVIQLMPVQEFDGNDSWGYNPAYFFAMDKAYGTSTQYKQFIDECHSRGIAVFLDVVYNHATGAHPFAELYWDSSTNKTSANNPYFNVDAPHPYSVFHDFNHESALVRDYVKQNLAYLINEYKFDGFRFDLTKGFTQNQSTESTASTYDQSRIDILKDYNAAIKAANPDAVVILEHFCNQDEEKVLAEDGMMLWRNANHSFCQSAMGYSDGSGFAHISTFGTTMPEDSWVGFMESHDEERMAYKQTAYSEEPLKSNLETRMKQLAANAAFGMLAPGPKMIWQFGELGYDYSINHNQAGTEISESNRTGRKPIKWDYFDNQYRKGLYNNYSKLLKLRSYNPDLFEQSALKDLQVAEGNWGTGRYMTFTSGDKKLILMGNFTNSDIASTVQLPSDNTWYNFATGAATPSGTVTIPANSYLIFTNFEVL